MANPQPTDAHLRIAHVITEEIMMRDFTKRQRSILDLVLRLSWGCNKKEAIIPKLRYFELCGIPQTKIKSEITYLVNARVIFWEESTNQFWFNKNYEEWKISIVKGYDRNFLAELIYLNVKNTVDKPVDNHVDKETLKTEELPKMGSDFPKGEESSHLERGSNFPKEEVLKSSNPVVSKGEGVYKEIIKESNTTITIKETQSDELEKDSQGTGDFQPAESEVEEKNVNRLREIEGYYAANVLRRNIIGSVDLKLILEAYRKYPTDFILSCIEHAVKQNKERNGKITIKSFSYFVPILEDEWEKYQIREASKNAAPVQQDNKDFKNKSTSGPKKYSTRFHLVESRGSNYTNDELEEKLLKKERVQA
ncbi:prophage lambdaCh01, replication protein O [Clostridium aceticum]|uniref:Prophage lambdaCh01, replication protein O n=1 Tax=Clostridium aceticum TaxID=84022 RepID=A0A0G3WAV1_9CLOT|nr:replication protein [Clostridium aceticum]AKL94995.1 prophage lambdaCh01, replication protein O [Clostridium aceticum]